MVNLEPEDKRSSNPYPEPLLSNLSKDDQDKLVKAFIKASKKVYKGGSSGWASFFSNVEQFLSTEHLAVIENVKKELTEKSPENPFNFNSISSSIFIPCGLVVNMGHSSRSDLKNIQTQYKLMTIDSDSWETLPYLEGLEIKFARAEDIESTIKELYSISVSDHTFVDVEEIKKNNLSFIKLLKATGTAGILSNFPFEWHLVDFLSANNISDQKFADSVALDFFVSTELQSPKNFVFTQAITGKNNPTNEEILTTIAHKKSPIHKLIDIENSDVRKFFIDSFLIAEHKLAGAIGAIKKSIKDNNPNNALITFYALMSEIDTFQKTREVSPTSQGMRMFMQSIYDVFKFQRPEEIYNFVDNNPAKALEFLEKIYAFDFYTVEQRLGMVKSIGSLN